MEFIKSLKTKIVDMNIAPEKFFLVTALVFGMTYCLLTPLFQGPDEPNHFLAISRYSNGYLTPITENSKIGTRTNSGAIDLYYRFPNLTNGNTYSYKTQIPTLLKINLGKFRSQFVKIPASTYLPFSYTQYIFTYILGAIFNLNPYILFILMRIVGLIVWILLTYFAIKIIPKGKWLLAIYALLPMSLFIASIVSADNITNGLVFLVVAMIFNGIINPKALTKKYVLVLLLTTLFLGITKQTFFVVSILLFALPIPSFISKKKYYLLSSVILIISAIVSFSWQLFTNKYALAVSIPGVDAGQQLKVIIKHPFYYLKVLWRTYFTFYSNPIYIGFIGVLGWLDTSLPIWLTFAWFAVLFKSMGSWSPKDKSKLTKWQVTLFLTIPILLIGMLTTALYLTWSPVKIGVVQGLQGRYFIPILAILLPVLVIKRAEPSIRVRGYLMIGAFLLQISTILVLIARYT